MHFPKFSTNLKPFAVNLCFEELGEAIKKGVMKDEKAAWKKFYKVFDAIGPNTLARRVSVAFETSHKTLWNTIRGLSKEE